MARNSKLVSFLVALGVITLVCRLCLADGGQVCVPGFWVYPPPHGPVDSCVLSGTECVDNTCNIPKDPVWVAGFCDDGLFICTPTNPACDVETYFAHCTKVGNTCNCDYYPGGFSTGSHCPDCS